jgi:hypothetical protein
MLGELKIVLINSVGQKEIEVFSTFNIVFFGDDNFSAYNKSEN